MKKEEIVAQLRSYVARKGSQKKAANSLDGVSSATINKMLNGTDWETISEEMWRSVAQQTRTKSEGWQLADTSVHRELSMLLSRAQQDALVAGVIGAAGSGKTETCREYADEHRNVYHITCGEHWNRRTFVSKVLKSMGANVAGYTINDMMEEVVDALSRADNPLLILDEADKLSDQVLYFFITLYNQLEGRCGIVLCGTQYLKARIARGVRLGKKGFEEILSRLGRRFFELAKIGEEDVALVCVANGIESDAKIRKITKESESDLRRVKRSVWAAKNAA
ncbi:ATP-binding protein [uncultured Porphyromonas sp.]|uniref:ATP-binding protein n=1 Tax=uncultured Porphyromonas sp. TaxID=159274 RepID=UPI00261F5447|nr:ATP-binding protein [uncultured Porphyromonas sp.]